MCHRFSAKWSNTSELNNRISFFNEQGGGFSRFKYSDGVNNHCRSLGVGIWWMILHSDIAAGQPTLPD